MLITIHPYRDLVILSYNQDTITGDVISELKISTPRGLRHVLIKERIIFMYGDKRTYWLNPKDRFIFSN